MKKAYSIFFLLFSVFCLAQKIEKQNALVTIKGNVGIPRMISSKMFATCFSGIAEANLNVNVRLFDNFYAGGGYQYSYFQNSKFLKFQYFNNSIPYNTRMVGNAGFIKFTYDRFFSNLGYVSYSINSGLMFFNYSSVNADTSLANRPYGVTNFSAPYVQPEISLSFITDKRLSFSIMMSYTTMFYKFDPKAPRFNHFQEISSASNRYVMSWLSFGLGFHILLDKKAKAE